MNPNVVVEEVLDEDEMDLMAQVRQASDTPTALSEFLQLPDAIRTLTKPRRSAFTSRSPSSSRGMTSPSPPPESVSTAIPIHRPKGKDKERDRDRDRDRDKDRGRDRDRDRPRPSGRRRGSDATNSMLSIVLAEEERQANHLKAMLRITGDRLQNEMRKADDAETRATLAEVRARDMTSRATSAEHAQHAAELESARAREETKRYQMQAENAEREVRRLTGEVAKLQRQKEEAEEEAARARDVARKWQAALRDFQSRAEGKEEGMRMALFKRFDDGRAEGFEDGHSEGWEAGRAEGFEEGRRRGIEQAKTLARNEERLAAYTKPPTPAPHPSRFYEEMASRYDDDDRTRFYDDGRTVALTEKEYNIVDPPQRYNSPAHFERIKEWAAESTTQSSKSTPPKPAPVWLRRRTNTPVP